MQMAGQTLLQFSTRLVIKLYSARLGRNEFTKLDNIPVRVRVHVRVQVRITQRSCMYSTAKQNESPSGETHTTT